MPRRTHSGPSPNRRLGARLRLEILEDRLALSTTPTIDLSGLSLGSNYSSNDVLVQYRQGATPFALSGTSLGGAVGLVDNLYKINLSSGVSVDSALAEYQADTRVQFAELDYALNVSSIPNDPRFSDQWGLSGTAKNINAASAWDHTTGSTKIVVALMDTGMDYDHPDLYENVWINQGEIPSWIRSKLTDVDGDGIITFRDLNNPINQGASKAQDVNHDGRITASDLLAPTSQGGWADGIDNDGDGYVDDIVGWNFADNNNRPFDDIDHGTHVAGIIGAMGNNDVGVAGVDWNVQLMPIKFIGPDGGSVSSFITGLDYAVQHGAKITNNSWSGAADSQALIDAVNAARSAGQVFVAAAGNNGTDNDLMPTYPANLGMDNVISVAATDKTGALASFSNDGAQSVDIAAPGVDILSTVPGNSYALNSGTSMATPFVTGVVALVWAKNPTWTYKQVITQVLSTAEKVPALQGKVATGGIVDAAAAVGAAQATSTPTPRVVTAVASGPSSSSMSSIRLTFDQAMNASTFTSVDAVLKSPSGATIAVSSVRQFDSLGKVFDVTFATQSVPGGYSLKVGPFVTNKNGVNMTAYSGNFIVTVPTATAPRVVTAVAMGSSSSSMSSIRLTFDQAVNASTFTAADCVLKSPSGATITVSGVHQVDSLGKVFDVTFATQSVPGGYSLKVGPSVTGKVGGLNMTTFSGNFIVTAPTATAPRVVTAVAMGSSSSSMSSIRLTFDQAVNASTFTAADCVLKSPSGATITVSGVRQFDSLGKVFDVTFATQSVPGGYSLKVGPSVTGKVGGLNMTTFSGNFIVTVPPATAPRVVTAVAMGSSSSSMSSIRLTFDQAVNASTFTAADCVLKSPSGATITVSGVHQVDSLGKVFDVTFATQSVPGGYSLKVGPSVTGKVGGLNMTTFSGNFIVTAPTATAPRVVTAVAMGSSSSSMSSIRLTFDQAVNASTFTAADCVLKSPSGATITVSGVKQFDSLGKVFDVTFATQWATGGYSLKVGPSVTGKVGGLNMTAYTGNFILPRATTASIASVASVASVSAPVTYSATKSAAITPNGKAVVMLTVKDDVRIADLNVRVNLTAPKPGILFVHLRAPNGTDVVLTRQTDGSYKLGAPLSELAGMSVKGTWTLWVEDRGGVNRGTVDSFALVVTPKAG